MPHTIDPSCEFERELPDGSFVLIRITDHDYYEPPSYDSPGQGWDAVWIACNPDTGDESDDLRALIDADEAWRIDEAADQHLTDYYLTGGDYD